MKMKHKETGEVRHMLKIRGITLNHENAQKIQYEDFKDLVLENYEDKIEIDTSQIRPTPESFVRTYHSKKIYRPFCQKGIIDDHLNLLPFGFNREL
jgi:3-methyladenine DNA glycosylase Tag